MSLAHAARLRAALERDGGWYRRGYFDDGTPFGSSTSEECRIDSIAQSWSVLSGAAEPARARRAMAAVDQLLIRRDEGLALLFTPPFERTSLDPGYIKGYPPGYTGSAGWLYRAGIEGVLGFRLQGEFLVLDPCIPRAWPGFEIVFRYRSARYEIAVKNPRGVSRGVASAALDGMALAEGPTRVALVDDGAVHAVRVILGSSAREG